MAVSRIPVIFLSAYGRDETVARVEDKGATDYIVKPFPPTELVARVRAALHRFGEPPFPTPEEPFMLGDLTIDHTDRRVTVVGTTAAADTHRVRPTGGAPDEGRAGVAPRPAAEAGMENSGKAGERANVAHPTGGTPPETSRRPGKPHLHLRRAPRRLPDAGGGDCEWGTAHHSLSAGSAFLKYGDIWGWQR